MSKHLLLGAAIFLSAGALAQPSMAQQAAVPETTAGWPEAYFEIFKLAPGRHEAFMRDVARADRVAAAGGQPPIQIFVHDGGADWDVLIFKPQPTSKPTAAQQAAMDAKAKELNMETGPAYFVNIRQNIAAHTDTKTHGPITAADWLARLEAWRASHPGRKQ